MPTGDRTGPVGQGPRTGRGLGFCSGYDTPGYAKGPGRGQGRGFGFGRGRGAGRGYGGGGGRGYGGGGGRGYGGGGGRGYGGGMGLGRGYGRAMGYGRGMEYGWEDPFDTLLNKDDEMKMLKARSESLKRSQAEIEKRLKELESENE